MQTKENAKRVHVLLRSYGEQAGKKTEPFCKRIERFCQETMKHAVLFWPSLISSTSLLHCYDFGFRPWKMLFCCCFHKNLFLT